MEGDVHPIRWMTMVAAIIAIVGCRSPDQPNTPPASRAEARAAAERLLASYRGRSEPIPVFVDGKRVTEPEPSGRFSVIYPDRIASIQLLTGRAGEAKAGAAGSRGVIWIVTKS